MNWFKKLFLSRQLKAERKEVLEKSCEGHEQS